MIDIRKVILYKTVEPMYTTRQIWQEHKPPGNLPIRVPMNHRKLRTDSGEDIRFPSHVEYACELSVELNDPAVTVVNACVQYKQRYFDTFPYTELWLAKLRGYWALEVIMRRGEPSPHRRYQGLKDNRGGCDERFRVNQIVCEDTRIVEASLRALARLIGSNMPWTPAFDTEGHDLRFQIRRVDYPELQKRVMNSIARAPTDRELEFARQERASLRRQRQIEENEKLMKELGHDTIDAPTFFDLARTKEWLTKTPPGQDY